MADEQDEKHSRSIIGAWMWVAPTVYVLSTGPIARIATMLPDELGRSVFYGLIILYYPLLFVAVTWKPFGDILKWYLKLWGFF